MLEPAVPGRLAHTLPASDPGPALPDARCTPVHRAATATHRPRPGRPRGSQSAARQGHPRCRRV